jgi:hypothetical protein
MPNVDRLEVGGRSDTRRCRANAEPSQPALEGVENGWGAPTIAHAIMVKGHSRLRTALALAAKAEVGCMFKPMIGGSYKKGATFNVLRQQTRTGMLFNPRYLM